MVASVQNGYKKLTYEILLIKNQARIQDCCNIQGGALCDNSYYKELHLECYSSPSSEKSWTLLP